MTIDEAIRRIEDYYIYHKTKELSNCPAIVDAFKTAVQIMEKSRNMEKCKNNFVDDKRMENRNITLPYNIGEKVWYMSSFKTGVAES